MLPQTTALGVSYADLCGAVADVGDEVDDGVLTGLEARVATPAAPAAASLDGAVTGIDDAVALQAAAFPLPERPRLGLQGLKLDAPHQRCRCLGLDGGVVAVPAARSGLDCTITGADGLIAPQTAAQPWCVPTRISDERFQGRCPHEPDGHVMINAIAGAPGAAALALPDVVE